MKIAEIATEKISRIKICSEAVQHIWLNRYYSSFEMNLQHYKIKIVDDTLIIEKAEDGKNNPPWEE